MIRRPPRSTLFPYTTLCRSPVADERSRALAEYALEPGAYLLVTAHRAGNVDDPARLERLVALVERLPGPVVFPLHPRTAKRLDEAGLKTRLEGAATVTPPLGYLDFLQLTRHAKAVLTDSGGVQKEAYLLETPCITLRDTTEWVETVTAGWNVLVDLDAEAALAALERGRSEEHTSELQSRQYLVCRLLLETKKTHISVTT